METGKIWDLSRLLGGSPDFVGLLSNSGVMGLRIRFIGHSRVGFQA